MILITAKSVPRGLLLQKESNRSKKKKSERLKKIRYQVPKPVPQQG